MHREHGEGEAGAEAEPLLCGEPVSCKWSGCGKRCPSIMVHNGYLVALRQVHDLSLVPINLCMYHACLWPGGGG